MGKPPINGSKPDIMQTAQQIAIKYWPLIVAVLLFLVVEWPALRDWWGIWNEQDSYYSHGFLVPPIAVFMLWLNRGSLARTQPGNSWLGLVLLLVFLPIHLIGLLMGLRVLAGVGFFIALYGAMLLMLGWRVTRIAFIPVLFMLTMVPLASWMLDNATGRYQLISASVATKFLQLTAGHDVTQYGNVIHSPGLPGMHTLLVGSPCSGLRLLISLVTFSWFFVYVVDGAWWKKTLLVGLSFPLSIFINSLRITMIGYVGFWTGSSESMHKFHDYSGYIGLLVCFVMLFGIAKLIKVGNFRSADPEPGDEGLAKLWRKPVGGGVPGAVVIGVFLIAAVSSTFLTPLYDLPKGHIDRASVPKSFPGWTGQDLPIDDNTRTILGKGDLMSRAYVDITETGRQVAVFLDAAMDLSAFHDPHLCLPGGGNSVTKEREVTLSFTKPRPFSVKATVLEASGDNGSSVVIYWYMLGRSSYPGTGDIADVNRNLKIGDLKRVVLSPGSTSQVRRDIRTRQFMWYRFSTEIIDGDNDEQFLRDFITKFVANLEDFGR